MAARASDKPVAVAAANVPMPPAKPVRVATVQTAAAKPVPAKPASYEIASATSTPVKLASYQVASAGSVPVKSGSYQVADATAAPARPAQAASVAAHDSALPSANAVINDRGYWQGLPSAEPVNAARTTVARSKPATQPSAAVATANAAPWPLTNRGGDRTPPVGALSYAEQPASPTSRANTLSAGHVIPLRRQLRHRNGGGQPRGRLRPRSRRSARARMSCRLAIVSTIPGCAP